MSLQLCSVCRCGFPPSSVEPAAFTDQVGRHAEAMATVLEELMTTTAVGPSTPSDAVRTRVLQLQTQLQDMCAAVHTEAAALRKQISLAEEQVARRGCDLEAANAKVAQLARNHDADGQAKPPKFSPIIAPRQAPVPTFNGAVASYQHRRMVTAFDLVSASIYSLLESLAIEARADTALLWLRPRGVVAVELVAPFVVGRNLTALRASAPYRVGESSMAATVAMTGTAVNMKPMVGVMDDRPTAEIPLQELTEKVNVAQLLVPVYDRYNLVGGGGGANGGSGANGSGAVIGVIHLIGSPRSPFPFSHRNEEASMHAALFLTSIMSSHYNVMAGEWGNHFYQPSTLHQTSTFQGRLDLRADEKAVDDFAPQPLLIYRCEKDPNAPADSREYFIALRAAVARAATPAQPVLTRVRDLYRHAATMETNWMSAVEATTRMEHRMGVIHDETVQSDVQQMRRTRASTGNAANNAAYVPRPPLSSAMAAASQAAEDAAAHEDSVTSFDGSVRLSPPLPISQVSAAGGNKSEPVLKPEEVDNLESVALRRLEDLGVDTAAFLIPPEEV